MSGFAFGESLPAQETAADLAPTDQAIETTSKEDPLEIIVTHGNLFHLPDAPEEERIVLRPASLRVLNILRSQPGIVLGYEELQQLVPNTPGSPVDAVSLTLTEFFLLNRAFYAEIVRSDGFRAPSVSLSPDVVFVDETIPEQVSDEIESEPAPIPVVESVEAPQTLASTPVPELATKLNPRRITTTRATVEMLTSTSISHPIFKAILQRHRAISHDTARAQWLEKELYEYFRQGVETLRGSSATDPAISGADKLVKLGAAYAILSKAHKAEAQQSIAPYAKWGLVAPREAQPIADDSLFDAIAMYSQLGKERTLWACLQLATRRRVLGAVTSKQRDSSLSAEHQRHTRLIQQAAQELQAGQLDSQPPIIAIARRLQLPPDYVYILHTAATKPS